MKELPDHGAGSSWEEQLNQTVFTKEFATALAKRFGLQGREQALLNAINLDAYWYQSAGLLAPPAVSEQRKLLKRVHQLATQLDDVMSKLGRYERQLMRKWIRHVGPHLLPSTIQAVHQLKYSSAKALDDLPTKSGAQKKYDLRVLIARLYATYSELTGDRRRYTYDSFGEEYRGPALEFIQECMQFLNIQKSDSTVIGILKEVLSDQG